MIKKILDALNLCGFEKVSLRNEQRRPCIKHTLNLANQLAGKNSPQQRKEKLYSVYLVCLRGNIASCSIHKSSVPCTKTKRKTNYVETPRKHEY